MQLGLCPPEFMNIATKLAEERCARLPAERLLELKGA